MLSVLSSCKNKLTEQELISYINDPENELTQEREINGIKYKVTYKPISLLINNSLSKSDSVDKDYERYYYFILSVSAGEKDIIYGSQNFQQFSTVLQKFSFGLTPYIKMTTDIGDTLALADYYVPNLYGMAKSTEVLLAFNKPSQKVNELEIEIDELGLGVGKQRFKFREAAICAIPELIEDFKH